jgi:hypothetical protein
MTDAATPLTLEQRVAALEAKLIPHPAVVAPIKPVPCAHCAAMQAKITAAHAAVQNSLNLTQAQKSAILAHLS